MKNNVTLYFITLEPIEQRYTKQWYFYWKKEFSKYIKNVIYIDGNYNDDKITNGKFLDINKTNIYKAQQVEKLGNMFNENKIKDNDIFIFCDGWHFGITALKYMLQLNNIKSKIYGYFHAGSYDPYDFLNQAGMKKWAQYNESGWMHALDGIFVATKFHKELILENLNILYYEKFNKNKIKVVGFPMDWELEIKTRINKINKKADLIVFPHRLDKEKNPQQFDELKKEFQQYNFIKTLEVTKNKYEYYNLMNKAKICFSASNQETFGIGTVEALMMNVIPLVPNRLSYIELYDRSFIYNNIKEAKIKLKYFMNNYYSKSLQNKIKRNKKKIIKSSLNSIKKMSEVMLQ